MTKVDRKAMLAAEMARLALVLRGADLDTYERAANAVAEAINGLPDYLPAYEPALYRITPNTGAARFATESTCSVLPPPVLFEQP